MIAQLRKEALDLANQSIKHMHPSPLLEPYLSRLETSHKMFLISIGKAAWQMAKAAVDELGDKIEKGFVITKYQHSLGENEKCTPKFEIQSSLLIYAFDILRSEYAKFDQSIRRNILEF